MVAVDVAAATNIVLTNRAASQVAVVRNVSPDFIIGTLLRKAPPTAATNAALT